MVIGPTLCSGRISAVLSTFVTSPILSVETRFTSTDFGTLFVIVAGVAEVVGVLVGFVGMDTVVSLFNGFVIVSVEGVFNGFVTAGGFPVAAIILVVVVFVGNITAETGCLFINWDNRLVLFNGVLTWIILAFSMDNAPALSLGNVFVLLDVVTITVVDEEGTVVVLVTAATVDIGLAVVVQGVDIVVLISSFGVNNWNKSTVLV